MSRVDRVKLEGLRLKVLHRHEWDQVMAAFRDAADALDALDTTPWYRPILTERRIRAANRAQRVLREESERMTARLGTDDGPPSSFTEQQ